MRTQREQLAPWCRWMPRWLLLITVTLFLSIYTPLYLVCMSVAKVAAVFADVFVIIGRMYRETWRVDRRVPVDYIEAQKVSRRLQSLEFESIETDYETSN